MSTAETSPTFNLKAVVLETGIKPHTLRSWERKYGLPRPLRTQGKHRIYTQKDIDTVKWLIARLDEGMTISRAIELWHHLEGRDEDPLTVAAYQAGDLVATSGPGDALADIRQKWVANCLRFDKAAAENVLTQAFAIYPVKMVCQEILQKGLSHIGDLWFRNLATVHQEHFASALTIERLNALLAAAPMPTRIGRILVACPPHEEHTIGLLVLSLLLRYRGWDVVYLGANIPFFQLESTIEAIKPELVVLAAQRLQTAASLSKLTQLLNDKGVNAAFGGSVFSLIPSLNQRIYGHFLGESIEDATQIIGQIMAFDPPVMHVKPIPEPYEQATSYFRTKRHLIEFDLRQMLERENFPLEHMNGTNARLGQDILAALNLGDISFLNSEIKLARNLIANYGVPLDFQSRYFEAYFRAAEKNLNGTGTPIVEWLDKLRSEFKGR